MKKSGVTCQRKTLRRRWGRAAAASAASPSLCCRWMSCSSAAEAAGITLVVTAAGAPVVLPAFSAALLQEDPASLTSSVHGLLCGSAAKVNLELRRPPPRRLFPLVPVEALGHELGGP